jgi:hypothetical protein
LRLGIEILLLSLLETVHFFAKFLVQHLPLSFLDFLGQGHRLILALSAGSCVINLHLHLILLVFKQLLRHVQFVPEVGIVTLFQLDFLSLSVG